MLLPALSKARERAQATKCLSNLKQCGTGWSFYGNDWQGYMPLNYPDQTLPSPAAAPSSTAGTPLSARGATRQDHSVRRVRQKHRMFALSGITKVNTYSLGRVYGAMHINTSPQRRPEDWWRYRIRQASSSTGRKARAKTMP